MNVSEPALNTSVSVNIGDVMVRQGVYAEQEALRVDQPIKIGLLNAYTLLPGMYVKQGESPKGAFYLPDGTSGSGSIQTSPLADPYQSVFLQADNTTICVITIFNIRKCESGVTVTRTKVPSYKDSSFQQTLLYLGKDGNKINIGYREFSNDMARPAFNNDVQYDLNESRTIGYKGATIEVVEATNQYIRYFVVKNFNSDK